MTVDVFPTGNKAILCFETAAIVQALIEQKYVIVKNRSIFIRAFKAGEMLTWWDREKLKIEEQLQGAEMDKGIAKMKELKQFENRSA